MKTLHAKSPCCQGKIHRFGNRRRQCSWCKRTWSVRQKKRGKKPYCISKGLFHKTLIEGQTLKQQLRSNYPSIGALRKRFRYLLHQFYRRDRKVNLFNEQRLIIVGDGLWFKFKGQDWVLYLMVIKPVKESIGVILNPLFIAGKENYTGWQKVIETISPFVKKRIKALVSDNFRGSTRLCHELGWIHQLCHFHLIARLQVLRGRRKTSLPHRNLREKVYQNIRLALETQESRELKLIKRRLKRWSNHSNCPKKIASITREFLKEINCYRTYLNYPKLNLPTTTNSVEALGKIIRQTTKKLNTPNSVKLWVTALIKLRSTITCNGKDFQQN